MKTILMRGLAVIVLCLAAIDASAQTCTISTSLLDFGTRTSPTPQVDSTATASLSCTSASSGSKRVCVDATATSDTMGGVVTYSLYSDAARSNLWTPQEYTITYNTPINLTAYGRVASGQSAASGTYNGNTLTLRMRQPAGGSPCGNYTGSVLSTQALSSKIIIANSCTISTSPISFGTITSLATAINTSGSLSVNCNSGASYTVTLDGGTTTGSIAGRMMSLGGAGAGVITYQLYRDSGPSNLWGNGVTGVAYSGTGSGSSQTIPIYAQIPSQATPAVGSYKDTVTATVTF